jgi:hypothetical protein
MATETAVDPRIRQFLTDQLSPSDLEKCFDFLNKGDYGLEAQIALASAFVFAKEHKVDASRVIEAMQKEWERNWKYQHPQIRASADAPGAAGMQNRASLENIYSSLGIPSPAHS